MFCLSLLHPPPPHPTPSTEKHSFVTDGGKQSQISCLLFVYSFMNFGIHRRSGRDIVNKIRPHSTDRYFRYIFNSPQCQSR